MNIHAYAVPEEDRGTFVKFMALVARADGHLADEEVGALENAMQAWGITGAERDQVRAIMESGAALDELAGGFSNPRTRYLLVQELVMLAHLDGQYAEAERTAIVEIAKAVGVSPNRVDAIEGWVRDGIAWRERGLALIEPEEV